MGRNRYRRLVAAALVAGLALASARYAELLDSLRPEQRSTPSVEAIGWMIEELRVSLFAQRLGTQGKVSVQRIAKAIAAIDA